ncbi:MAG: zinc-dependent alcohol dehydrogenase family protein [Verrucomicrobia bacterium]|nr:zinc-dependent alcohol dehydrogenase family protein [Verrucomicrobiota bacterium]MBV9272751.1 zinc-dependent alcohol dehydrogenase family protein [Verrucomicrobiota bacterium]
MVAMLLNKPRTRLELTEIAIPTPKPGEILVKVEACAVCRTDLHLIDGELAKPKLPIIPGHEIVGTVTESQSEQVKIGQRIGIPWLGWTCGQCQFCLTGRENLCENALFTGYTRDGGYAEYTVADERFCFPMPAAYNDPAVAAPLLCAGLIGYRSLVMAGPPDRIKKLGIYGFGAAAHLVAQVARHQHRQVFAFTRRGDSTGQRFALKLGAAWAGASDELPPELLDAAIIFAPAGSLVPLALQAVDKGGRVVCGGIHMSDIPSFGYDLLWGERTLCSVANLTRQDANEFLRLAPIAGIRPSVTRFPLAEANEALDAVRHGGLDGAAVLVV